MYLTPSQGYAKTSCADSVFFFLSFLCSPLLIMLSHSISWNYCRSHLTCANCGCVGLELDSSPPACFYSVQGERCFRCLRSRIVYSVPCFIPCWTMFLLSLAARCHRQPVQQDNYIYVCHAVLSKKRRKMGERRRRNYRYHHTRTERQCPHDSVHVQSRRVSHPYVFYVYGRFMDTLHNRQWLPSLSLSSTNNPYTMF